MIVMSCSSYLACLVESNVAGLGAIIIDVYLMLDEGGGRLFVSMEKVVWLCVYLVLRGRGRGVKVCSVFYLADDEVGEELQERDQLRYERHKERERERRLARAHPERRSVVLLFGGGHLC